MIDINNETDLNIPIALIEKITDSLTDRDIDLLVTDDAAMKEINTEYRNIEKSTDVLSFPFEDMPMGPLGSMVISTDFVKRISMQLGHTNDDEFCLLYIHGLLHLLGFDHETDNGEMRQKEKDIIEAFGLPASLIIRTQG
jgi:probable rRNA maturation factor